MLTDSSPLLPIDLDSLYLFSKNLCADALPLLYEQGYRSTVSQWLHKDPSLFKSRAHLYFNRLIETHDFEFLSSLPSETLTDYFSSQYGFDLILKRAQHLSVTHYENKTPEISMLSNDERHETFLRLLSSNHDLLSQDPIILCFLERSLNRLQEPLATDSYSFHFTRPDPSVYVLFRTYLCMHHPELVGSFIQSPQSQEWLKDHRFSSSLSPSNIPFYQTDLSPLALVQKTSHLSNGAAWFDEIRYFEYCKGTYLDQISSSHPPEFQFAESYLYRPLLNFKFLQHLPQHQVSQCSWLDVFDLLYQDYQTHPSRFKTYGQHSYSFPELLNSFSSYFGGAIPLGSAIESQTLTLLDRWMDLGVFSNMSSDHILSLFHQSLEMNGTTSGFSFWRRHDSNPAITERAELIQDRWIDFFKSLKRRHPDHSLWNHVFSSTDYPKFQSQSNVWWGSSCRTFDWVGLSYSTGLDRLADTLIDDLGLDWKRSYQQIQHLKKEDLRLHSFYRNEDYFSLIQTSLESRVLMKKIKPSKADSPEELELPTKKSLRL